MKVASFSSDNIIYADNAATTRVLDEVAETMMNYQCIYYGNPSSRHLASRIPNEALNSSKRMIASCINCDESEIYFTSGGTESDNWALEGVLSATDRTDVIISCIEHPAILEKCKQLKNKGYNVIEIGVDNKGTIDISELKKEISDNTAIVSIMHSNNELGTVQDMSTIADIVHRSGSILHTDAVQSLGHIKIDVQEMKVDLLSGSGHKFNGPKGVGFLYCKKTIPFNALIVGGHQQNNMRSGTENVPGIIGMACALKNNCDMMQENLNRISKMENKIREILANSGLNYVINGNNASKIPGILNVSFKDISGEALVDILSMKKICISTGSACNSKTMEISNVLKAIRVDQNYINGTIRISLGRFNTEEESSIIGNTIIELVKKLTYCQHSV